MSTEYTTEQMDELKESDPLRWRLARSAAGGGTPIRRTQPAPAHIPGAVVGFAEKEAIRHRMTEINLALLAVHGSDVIAYPRP